MLSQGQDNHHRPHFPSLKKDSRNPQQAQQNVIYLAVALAGGLLLVTKPALILLVLALMGYGKYYHVETHEKSHGLFREKQSEHSLHLGPSHERGVKRASFPDLAKTLNLPKVKY